MRRSLVLLAAVVAAVAVAVPANAAGKRINVVKKLESALPDVKQTSAIPVRIPSFMNAGINASRVFGRVGKVREGRYRLELGIGRSCNGASVCFVASFHGRKNAELGTRGAQVQLARGLLGYYREGRCGANCSPGTVQWVQRGVVYDVKTKFGRGKTVRLANRAIRAGAR
jgi:hypothetical protein